MSKYKSDFSSIHYNDESFFADENGIIEGCLPDFIVCFYKLQLIKEAHVVGETGHEIFVSQTLENKEEKKNIRKPKKDKKEGE